MARDSRAYLWDIVDRGEQLQMFINGYDLSRYQQDEMVRAACERLIQIIGEAVRHLKHHDPQMASRLSHTDSIIAFRNILVHAYHNLDHARIWFVLVHHLPVLISEARRLLDESR